MNCRTKPLLAALCFVLFSSGCSVSVKKLAEQPYSSEAERCEAFYIAFAHRTEGLEDPASHRIPEVPWLRTNRTLAAKAKQLLSRQSEHPVSESLSINDKWQQWLSVAAEFAISRQRLEWGRLSPTGRQQLLAVSQQSNLLSTLRFCRSTLETQWLAEPGAIVQIRRLTNVPDHYSSIKRFFGIYPITQWATRILLPGLKREFLNYFSKGPEQHSANGEWQYFSSKRQLSKAAQTGESELTQLDYFNIILDNAPIWRIDVASSDDIPGSIQNSARHKPAVGGQYSEYQYLSETWFDGKWRLQANYVLWFPRRTSKGLVDLLAGEIDSVVWRVTLDEESQPMVFDSIHSCGCYHLVIPTPNYQQRSSSKNWPEPPLVMPTLKKDRSRKNLQLTIASGNHYLLGVGNGSISDNTQPLTARPYNELLQQTVDGQVTLTSIFNTHGLVAGSQRPERWLLWPMGIRSAGAMRQAGTQAIAFVGRRHFDDSNLLDQILEPANP